MMKVRIKQAVVEERLARRGLSQRWLARVLGISGGYVSQLLSGKRAPSPKLRLRILALWGDLSFDDIFEIQSKIDG